MKFSFSAIFVLIGLTCSRCTFAQSSTFTLLIPPTLVRDNDKIEVQIIFPSSPVTAGIYSVTLSIAYPKSLSPLTDDISATLIPGDPTGNLLVSESNDPQSSQLRVELFSSQPFNLSKLHLDLFFRIERPGVTIGYLALINAVVQDKNGPWCCVDQMGDGIIHISAPAGPGDVDGDNKVMITDAQWALRLFLGAATGSPGVLKSADVWPPNAPDGTLTLADVRQLIVLALSG